jgi:hypothetical protein
MFLILTVNKPNQTGLQAQVAYHVLDPYAMLQDKPYLFYS